MLAHGPTLICPLEIQAALGVGTFLATTWWVFRLRIQAWWGRTWGSRDGD